MAAEGAATQHQFSTLLIVACVFLSTVRCSVHLVCAAKSAATQLLDEPEYFYWNEITGEVQWEDPGDVAFEDDAGIRFWLGSAGEKLSEEPRGHAYSWVEYYSEDLQRAYYFNQDTKETTWTRPDDLAWRRVPVKKQRS